MNRKHQKSMASEEFAEETAIAALAFIASEPERLDRFLSMTGLRPETLRAAALEPGFLGQVLNHLAEDESLLLAFAANASLDPASVTAAHQSLNRSVPGEDES